MRHDIEFEGFGGTLLRGWLYLPQEAVGAVPGIVMAHGLSAVKEMALDLYAEVFCRAGLAVLAYDHRSLGASEGEPRQQINPWAQTRDYRCAIAWLAARPEVDASRIGVWGSSYSGGEVIVLGACDERVAAVVANVPFCGYPGVDYGDTKARFEALRVALDDETGTGPADTAEQMLGPMAVVREPGGNEAPAVLDQPESTEWFLELSARAPSWQNSVTLVNAIGTEPGWDPGVCVAHVAPTPLLFVVSSQDRLADTAVSRAAYERAGEPRELVMVDGHHFVAYAGEGFRRASEAARRFFVRHLLEPPTDRANT